MRDAALKVEYTQDLQQVGMASRSNAYVIKPDGTRGFIDLLTFLDKEGKEAMVHEYKTTRFDRLNETQLHKRVEQYIAQIDSYRFGQIGGHTALDVSVAVLHIDVRPTSDGYAEYIENQCLNTGIMVFFDSDDRS